jgi:CO/xanthine dehydrogenase FAD-binding subunit
MRELEYAAPSSFEEAYGILADKDGAVPLAGGTDVLVAWRAGRLPVAVALDLRRLPGLRDIVHGGNYVTIGALVSMSELCASSIIGSSFPALVSAASQMGCWQVRNRATLGGNLCNASPSADASPPLLVYGASVLLTSSVGARELPLGEFLTGPGRTALGRGELLVGVRVPVAPADLAAVYLRRQLRRSMDIPLVNVAAGVRRAGGVVTEARVVLGAVAPTPVRAVAAEAALLGRPLDEAAIAAAGEAATGEARPITDVRASAEYRTAMVEVFVRRALTTLATSEAAA